MERVRIARPKAGSTPRRAWEELARAAGVSTTTASLALNNHPRVALRTRQRVAEVAAQLGFVRNHGARRLARTRANTRATSFEQVGLISLAAASDELDAACNTMMRGAEDELSRLNASLIFLRADGAEWRKVRRLTQAGAVDGWLIYGDVNDQIVERLRSDRLPYVIVGDHRCTQPVACVNVDNLAVGQLAARHLAELGHRRIAYMAGNMRFEHSKQILAGFCAAAREREMDLDPRLTVNLSAPPRTPLDWLQNLSPMPTAVFMPDFGVALSLYPILSQSPLPALREMSVLASGVMSPQSFGQEFTSIDLRMSEVGRCAVSLLHRMITDSANAESVRVFPALFEGRSTFAPPNTP